MIGNAVINIWQAEGVKPILKYEDDLKIFQYPVKAGAFQQDGFEYEYNRDEALSSTLHSPTYSGGFQHVSHQVTNLSHTVTYWSPVDSTGLQQTPADSGRLWQTPVDSARLQWSPGAK